ncbi:50S ribosomal protein L40e [Sulfolobales archaeon HS-7]|nr:50S ribosomal protein L40e [Sulfolobales archaeon HS-7]
MPINDPVKAQIVRKRLLEKKICRNCGATNSVEASKCRRCHSKNLRLKRKELASKKSA